MYTFWSATSPAGPAAPPDPRVLALQAIATMRLRAIGIGIVPEAQAGSIGIVGLPTWMWVADPGQHTWGPITRTASSAGYSVTATAKVQRVVWAMGDGNTVTCTKRGTPYADSFGKRAEPGLRPHLYPAGHLHGAGDLVLAGDLGRDRAERHDSAGFHTHGCDHDGRSPGVDQIAIVHEPNPWGDTDRCRSRLRRSASPRPSARRRPRKPPARRRRRRLRSRRRRSCGVGRCLVVASVAAVCLGALLGVWAYTSVTTAQEVVAVRSSVQRGALISREDLVTVRIGVDPALNPIPAAQLDGVVGQRAAMDLPAGGLVTQGQHRRDGRSGSGHVGGGCRAAGGAAAG